MDESPKPKIYQTTWALILGFCVVGPLVLPLLWRNPRFSRQAKWIWTLVFIAITIGLVWFSICGLGALYESLELIE